MPQLDTFLFQNQLFWTFLIFISVLVTLLGIMVPSLMLTIRLRSHFIAITLSEVDILARKKTARVFNKMIKILFIDELKFLNSDLIENKKLKIFTRKSKKNYDLFFFDLESLDARAFLLQNSKGILPYFLVSPNDTFILASASLIVAYCLYFYVAEPFISDYLEQQILEIKERNNKLFILRKQNFLLRISFLSKMEILQRDEPLFIKNFFWAVSSLLNNTSIYTSAAYPAEFVDMVNILIKDSRFLFKSTIKAYHNNANGLQNKNKNFILKDNIEYKKVFLSKKNMIVD